MPRGRGGSGGLSRRAALALIGGGGLLGVSSTGAFDQVQGQRPFDLSVNDENALLGVEVFSPVEISSSPATVDILELQNRFADSELTNLSVSADSDLLAVESLSGVTLQPTEKRTVSGTVSTDESPTQAVTLTITVSTDTEQIETTRTVDVVADLATGLPDGCPVSLNITVDVGDSATDGNSVSGDITNKDISGDITVGGDIEIKNSRVNGNVTATNDGDVTLSNNTEINGSVTADGDISVKKTTVGKGLDAGGDLTVEANSVVGNGARAGGNMTVKKTTFGGGLVAGGDITIEAQSTIGGAVEAGSDGDVTIKQTTVCGAVHAGGDVSEILNSNIGGDVTAGGDVDLENKATVFGNVITDPEGDVDVGNNAVVKGKVDASGDVTVEGAVQSGVFADGDVDGTGTINGNDPRPSSGSEDD